ncbi:MAG: hypothetical protein HY898_27810 [Deltaproteobacteria bacterium]|nr:hypothetical protein [Deltaproteobacteria bacterium]
MGRTLHYEVFFDRPISPETRREILLVQALLNYRFTWTCEALSLELFQRPLVPGKSKEFVFTCDPSDPRPRIGTGFTKVREDAWNACLVSVFLRWVSTRLPGATITLRDEGDYILAGKVFIRQGDAEIDRTHLTRIRESLVQNQKEHMLKRLDEVVQLADEGVFFDNSFIVQEYADRPEISGLRLTDDQLATVTLAEVADRVRMPWDVDWLIAGFERW